MGPFMRKIGISEHLVLKVTESQMGHLAVAYALYKIATPARYAVTLGEKKIHDNVDATHRNSFL